MWSEMKATVSYYDIEADKVLEKECFDFGFDDGDDFNFTPIDNPPKIYKSKCVLSPKIHMSYSRYGLKITVRGFVYVKGGGYEKSRVTITFPQDESL